MEQKLKSRDIIPGWPRGRSTSRPCAAGSVWPWVYVYSLMTPETEFIGVFPCMELKGLSRRMKVDDHTLSVTDSQMRQMDTEITQAEERRKAEMMEAWQQIERDGFREMIVLNLSHLLIPEREP